MSNRARVQPHPSPISDITRPIPPGIDNALQQFASHSLADLDKATLMNRVDTKYIVPIAVLEAILERLPQSYSALQIGNKKCFRYESTYFDTNDYLFYYLHHGGKLNRYKVRQRHYVDSNTQFLEVKFKNNKKRTLKQRIELSSDCDNSIEQHQEFLRGLNVPQAHSLQPILKNSYQRIALASEERGERLTIDLNLSNQSLSEQPNQQLRTDFAIVELKQARADRNSPFVSLARKFGLRPSSFSKYCMGMTFTQNNNDLKTNRFKPILRRLKRLNHSPSSEFVLC